MEGIMKGESKSLLITMSDDEILELVSAAHDDPDQEENTIVDLQTLCWETEAIVWDSAMLLTDPKDFDELLKFLVDREASFSRPLWTFVKSIGLEMSCEDGDKEIITLESRTLQVLKKLSKYSWKAKVVLAVASFALEYIQSDLLNKSVGILKQSTALKEPILHAMQLIKRTLELSMIIFNNEMTDIKIPVQVYWSIAIIVASATQIKLVTCQEQKKARDLSQFSEKLDYFFLCHNAESTLSTWKQWKDYTEWGINDGGLEKTGRLCLAQAMEVFRFMILPKDSTVQAVLIDGSTNQPVDIDVLRRKNLLLLFSGLDISDNGDLSPLKIIYEGTKQEDMHKIVWIPILESWTADSQRQYEDLRSKMPWYIVQCFSPLTTAMRFIKKEWKFKGKPILVVMNKYGTVKNMNALPLIRKEGMDAFPFHA